MRTVMSSQAKDVARWMQQDAAIVIDLREIDEAAGTCVPGAQPLPLSEFDLTGVPTEIGKRVVFLCTEGVRSATAAQQVLDDGWLAESFFVDGGVHGWARAGLPLGSCA